MDAFDRLIAIMTRLRAECPWDRKQTHTTLLQYLLEETYEVIEAVESGDDAHLQEELGDVLLQVVFHAEIARQEGRFEIADVIDGLSEKMIRRHPHVFGDRKVSGVDAVLQNWEVIKKEEKGAPTLDGVPRTLPALLRAYRVQEKASHVGFDWSNAADAFTKIEEEIAELQETIAHESPEDFEEELGDLLFAVVNVARHRHTDPEGALRRATEKFQARFAKIEATLAAQGKTVEDATLAEMDTLWENVKTRG